ncbi:MAG: flavodoxin family protein [Candidatus Methanomethylophilaceae archaeon]
MRIVVLSGSPRRNGNTDMLVDSFVRGASVNNEVEVIRAADLHVSPCIGCERCKSAEGITCSIDDDMTGVYDSLSHSDMLVLASPVYFYSITAQLKTVIDRLHTPVRRTYPIRRMGLLLVGASELPQVFDSILVQYQLVLDYFHLEDMGRILVRGVREKGRIKGDPSLEEAYRMGLSLR